MAIRRQGPRRTTGPGSFTVAPRAAVAVQNNVTLGNGAFAAQAFDAGGFEVYASNLGAVTSVATATVGSDGSANATLSATLGAVTAASTATVPVSATASNTLGATTLAATATAPDNAALAVTLGATTVSATASVPNADLSVAQTLGATTVVATATDPVSASASDTLGAVTSAATATVIDNAATSSTLGAVTLASTATVPDNASLSQTLGGATLAAVASVPTADLALSKTLGAVSVAATATDPVVASASNTLGAVTLDASATTGDVALLQLDATLGAVSVSATATDPVSASAAVTLGAVTAAATLTTNRSASLSATLGDVSVASTATVPASASVDATLGGVTSQGTATTPDHAQLAATLGGLSVASTLTAVTVAAPMGEAPLIAARPDPVPAIASRRSATVVAARRSLPATSTVLRAGGVPLIAARAAAGEIEVCRLGDALMSALRPSRGRPKLPVMRSARLVSTLGAASVAATAEQIAPIANNATLSRTLSAMHSTGFASATSPDDAALSATLGAVDLTARFITGSTPVARDATLSATLAPLNLAATIAAPTAADFAAAATLGATTLHATAANRLAAAVSKTLGTVTVAAQAHFPRIASLSRTLGAVSASGSATVGDLARGATILNVSSSYGDGVQDATLAIQAKIDALPVDGGTVVVPAGTFLINTTRLNPGGLKLRSNMWLQLATGCTLKAKTNTAPRDYVLLIQSVHDVEVSGGRILGDLATFVPSSTTTTDEWGHGIACYGSSKVYVHDIELTQCVGDGMSVGGKSGVDSLDIHIQRVTSTYNRRQGLSLVGCNRVLVEDSEFAYTKGTSPECGIDIEPESTGQAQNITIRNCNIHHNTKYGILALKRSDGGPLHDVLIEGNEIHHQVSRGLVVNGATNVTAQTNDIHDNGREGFSTSAPVGLLLASCTFHNNYTAGGANTARSFDQTGTSSKTSDDILLSPNPLPAGNTVGLNYFR